MAILLDLNNVRAGTNNWSKQVNNNYNHNKANEEDNKGQ